MSFIFPHFIFCFFPLSGTIPEETVEDIKGKFDLNYFILFTYLHQKQNYYKTVTNKYYLSYIFQW